MIHHLDCRITRPTQVPELREVTLLPDDGATPTVLLAEIAHRLPTAVPTQRAQLSPTFTVMMNCRPVRCLVLAPSAQRRADTGLSAPWGGRAVPIGRQEEVLAMPQQSGDSFIWLMLTLHLLSEYFCVSSVSIFACLPTVC